MVSEPQISIPTTAAGWSRIENLMQSLSPVQSRRGGVRSAAVLTGFVMTFCLSGCGERNMYVEPPPPEVTTSPPVERTVTEYLEFTGMTQPVETVEIRARVKGFLKERHFTEGAEVKKDQLLLVIDEETFQIQLEAAQTKLHEAEAALKRARESKAREVAKAQLGLSETQLELARQDEQRIRNLANQKVSTQSDLDQATAMRKARAAEVEAARANLDQADVTYETEILTAEAQVASAQIAVRNAKLDLSYCRMYAPLDGRISHTRFDLGNLVGDGQSSVLATIVKIDPVHAYMSVSEDDLVHSRAMIRDGVSTGESMAPLPIELGLGGEEGYPHHGQIDYSDAGLDPGTGTIRSRGVFPNEDRTILPGMFVRLRVPIGEPTNSLLVPERALGSDQSGRYVLVVGNDNVVEQRPVKVGMGIDGLRVIKGNLTASDQIIVEGLLRARAGQKVTPKPPVEEPAPKTADATPALH